MITGVPLMINGVHQGSISVVADYRALKQAQAAQRKSEAEFQQLFQNAEVAMYRSSPDGEIITINPALARLIGYSSVDQFFEETGGIISPLYVNPDIVDVFRNMLKREGRVSNFESELYLANSDETIWVLESAYATYDADDKIEYYEGILIDITDNKHFEEELMRSETFFRTIFENTADGITVIKTDGSVMMMNQAQIDLVGYNLNSHGQLNVRDYVHPDDYDASRKRFYQALGNHENHYEINLRFIHQDGRVLQINANIGIVRDDNGEHLYSISIHHDVTEAHKLQRELEDSENRFRSIFENASLPIVVTRDDRFLGMVNPAFCDLVGYSAEELTQMRFDDITFPGDNDENLVLFQQLINHEIEFFTVTKRYMHRNGNAVWCNISVSRFGGIVPGEDGQHLHTIAIVENITERKRAEERLLAEMALTDQLIDALPGIFYFVDQQGNFLRWNRQLQILGGYTFDEMLNITATDFFDESLSKQLREATQQIFTDGYIEIEIPLKNKDGESIPYLLNGFSIQHEGKPHLLGVGIDISDLKRAEHALRESEERYRSMFENSLIGMYRSTVDNQFINVNRAMVEIFGYDSVEELCQINISQELYVQPESRYIADDHSIEDDIIEQDYVLLKKKNGDQVIANVRSRVIRDEQGNIAYFEGSLEDVTEKYKYDQEIQRLNQELEKRVEEATRELRDSNTKLLELDRLRTKFIADMSHEMRTPLTVLNTRLYLMQRNKNPEKLDHHIQSLQSQLDRLGEFVENAFDMSLLDAARHKLTFSPISLNSIVAQAIEALRPRAEIAGLQLIDELASDLPSIPGVGNHLSQVATNIISNAIKYTAEGSITVSTGYDEDTRQVYLKVQDTGMGISQDDKLYLFTRFYRGKRAGQSTIPGTGLGLSIVKEIIDNHKGKIEVESQINEGSTFTIWLPCSNQIVPSQIAKPTGD